MALARRGGRDMAVARRGGRDMGRGRAYEDRERGEQGWDMESRGGSEGCPLAGGSACGRKGVRVCAGVLVTHKARPCAWDGTAAHSRVEEVEEAAVVDGDVDADEAAYDAHEQRLQVESVGQILGGPACQELRELKDCKRHRKHEVLDRPLLYVDHEDEEASDKNTEYD